jgi:hypothetical protein
MDERGMGFEHHLHCLRSRIACYQQTRKLPQWITRAHGRLSN